MSSPLESDKTPRRQDLPNLGTDDNIKEPTPSVGTKTEIEQIKAAENEGLAPLIPPDLAKLKASDVGLDRPHKALKGS
jgi:hypothetical protein